MAGAVRGCQDGRSSPRNGGRGGGGQADGRSLPMRGSEREKTEGESENAKREDKARGTGKERGREDPRRFEQTRKPA